MDPVSMGVMAMAGSAGGGIMGAVGSIFGGQAKSQQYQYQAGIARMNAAVAKQNKEWALVTGEREARVSGTKTGLIIGQQKVAQAAGNLDVNTGSALAVRESQHKVGLEDQTTIRINAGRKAYGFDVDAASLTAQASMYDTAADNAEIAGWIGAGSSLLGGASSVASKWSAGADAGMWGSGSRGGSSYGGSYLT